MEEKKKNEKKSGIKLTKDQKKAVCEIKKFIKSGNPNGWFVLSGKAGTGKTTTISEVINSLDDSQRVICGAISHKAKKVLESKIHNDRIAVGFYTIAAMLNMQLNMETGKFEPTYSENIIPPISNADIIFIDECSMIDEDAMALIMSMKKSGAKVIYLGDVNQLPPIRENEGNHLSYEQVDAVSPTFGSPDIFYLNERLRQGEESPILPFSDVYSHALSDGVMQQFPRENILGKKGCIYFTTIPDAVSTAIVQFKNGIETGDMELIKVICYRNETRRQINEYVRNQVFDNPKDEFVENDMLIMMDNYQLNSEGDVVENSTEFQVRSVEKCQCAIDGEYINFYSINTTYKMYGRYVSLPVCSKESRPVLNNLIRKRFDAAREAKKGPARTELFQKAYKLRNRFANLDYSYAITSHKSQGSTYKAVIVCESDIMQCYATSWRTKIRSMYTAITRASKMCVIAN